MELLVRVYHFGASPIYGMTSLVSGDVVFETHQHLLEGAVWPKAGFGPSGGSGSDGWTQIQRAGVVYRIPCGNCEKV